MTKQVTRKELGHNVANAIKEAIILSGYDPGGFACQVILADYIAMEMSMVSILPDINDADSKDLEAAMLRYAQICFDRTQLKGEQNDDTSTNTN
jgi:hypothetical protein